MTVRVRSVPPCVSGRSPTVSEGSARNDALAYARASDTICVSSQIGSRHLPLKQGIVSSSLTWRTNFISGCGVTQASESWELVVTVQFCPPRPKTLPIANVRLPIGLPHGINRQLAIENRQCLGSCSSNGRARRFERRGCGFKSCQEFHVAQIVNLRFVSLTPQRCAS